MAVHSLYFKDAAPSGATTSLSLQDGGTAPTGANTTTGWTVASTAINNMSAMVARSKATGFSTSDALASFNVAACWRSENTFTGAFANTNWTFAFRLRAVTRAGSQTGAVKIRVWRSTNANGTGATQLTSAVLTGTTTAVLSTTVSATSTVTWTPGATQTLNNEYLWVQCEWNIGATGGNPNCDAMFYVESAGVITTSDFVPTTVGTLNVTQANQTISAAGSVPYVGTLNVTQANQTISARGTNGAAGAGLPTEFTNIVTGFGISGSEHNSPGVKGFVFTPTTDLPVNSIGIPGPSGGWQTIRIAEWDTQTVIAEFDIPVGGERDNRTAMYYHSIYQTVTLKAGTRYFVGGVDTGSAPYRDFGTVTTQNVAVGSVQAAYISLDNTTWSLGAADQSLWTLDPAFDPYGDSLLVSFYNQQYWRNDYTGNVGISFVANANKTFNSIGVMTTDSPDAGGTQVLRLFQVSPWLKLGEATVTGVTTPFTWYWGTLDPPVDLVSGQQYFLAELVTAGVTTWWNDNRTSPHYADVTYFGAGADDGSGFSTTGTDDTGWVGLNMAWVEPVDTSGITGRLRITEAADTISATGTVTGVGIDTSLIAHWKLSDGSGTDLTGHSNDGVFNGGVTPSTGGPMGNAAIFTTGGYVANDQVINIPFVTISVWIKPIPSGANMQIAGFANGFANDTTDKDFVLNGDGTLSWYIYNGTPMWLNTFDTVTDGNWHHVVGTYDNVTSRIYIDGILSASTPVGGGSYAGYDQPNVFLGGLGHPNAHGAAYYVGALDDFQLYDRALSAAEVATLYNAGASGPAPVTGTLTVIETNDGVVASGDPRVGATLTVTEALDTILAAGSPRVGGALGLTEALDTINALAYAAALGNLNATQANQTIVSAGGPRVDGTLTATEALDTIISAGAVPVGGVLAQTEALDTIISAGAVPVGGVLTQPQAAHTLVAAGGPRVGGTLSVNETNDTLTAQAGGVVSGALAATEALDTLAASGTVVGQTGSDVIGTLTRTEADDTIAATGTSPWIGTLTQTQLPQTLAAAAGVTVRGTLTQPQAAQTMAAVGGPLADGALAATEALDTLAAAGTVRVGGALGLTEALDTIAGAASVRVDGALNQPQAPHTIAATGTVLSGLAGALTQTQQPQALAATGGVVAGAGLSLTEALDTLASQGRVGVGAVLSRMQDDQTIAGAARVTVAAVLAVIQDSQIILARGSVAVGATLTQTQEAHAINATMQVGDAQARVMVMA